MAEIRGSGRTWRVFPRNLFQKGFVANTYRAMWASIESLPPSLRRPSRFFVTKTTHITAPSRFTLTDPPIDASCDKNYTSQFATFRRARPVALLSLRNSVVHWSHACHAVWINIRMSYRLVRNVLLTQIWSFLIHGVNKSRKRNQKTAICIKKIKIGRYILFPCIFSRYNDTIRMRRRVPAHFRCWHA